MKLKLLSLTVAVATIVLALSARGSEPAASALKETSSFAPTISKPSKPPNSAPEGMVWISGGEFSMGSEGKCDGKSCCSPSTVADALPIHRVDVDGFWMDATDVTNAEFAKFVQATGYVTIAERPPTKEEFPTTPPENLVAGSVVFSPTSTPVSLDDHLQWWSYVKGADWRHPEGPQSDLKGKENYPVVQMAYPDAVAYAKWAGKRLPTEAEWEFAARGGLSGKLYTWGDEFKRGGKFMANTYQGQFPVKDTGDDGFAGISPVGAFSANGYGLYDMAGNVWQWCSDWYRPDYFKQLAEAGNVTQNPQGPEMAFDPAEPNEKKRVQKGGSYLCTDQYCTRYMVGTRGKGEVNTGTNHLGFRCVMTVEKSQLSVSNDKP
jgi:formylglycine-generating enzyme